MRHTKRKQGNFLILLLGNWGEKLTYRYKMGIIIVITVVLLISHFRRFSKFRKASSCPSVRMVQFGYHWTENHVLIFEYFSKICRQLYIIYTLHFNN
jgi:hypothetical protein